jgi:hypothetical protein
MHGMVNRALQGFIVANCGPDVWEEVRSIARLPEDGFEAMHTYDHAVTLACFGAAVDVLDKHPNTLAGGYRHLSDHRPRAGTAAPPAALRRRQFRGIPRLAGGTARSRAACDAGAGNAGNHPAAEGGGRFRIAARWPVPGIAPLLRGRCARWPTTTARWSTWNWRGSKRVGIAADRGPRHRFQRGRSFSLGQAVNERAGRFRQLPRCRGRRGAGPAPADACSAFCGLQASATPGRH